LAKRYSLIPIFILIISFYLIEAVFADEAKVIALDATGETAFIDAGLGTGIRKWMPVELYFKDARIAKLKVIDVFETVARIKPVDSTDSTFLRDGLIVKYHPDHSYPATRSPTGRFFDKYTHHSNHVEIELDSGITSYQVTGSKGESFYTTDTNYIDDVGVRLKDIEIAGADVEAYGSFRATDDRYLETTDEYLLEELWVRAKGFDYELHLGDVSTTFSRYTLSQSLKGIYFNKEVSESTDLEMIAGTTKHRWNDFWGEIEDEEWSRYVFGSRLSYEHSRDARFGLSIAETKDDRHGKSYAGNPLDCRVGGFDTNLSFFDKQLVMDGELAYSWTNTNTNNSANEYSSDWAGKLKTRIDFLRELSVIPGFGMAYEGLFERVGQNFSSASGWLKTDRAELYNKVLFSIYDVAKGYVGYRDYHDNLKKGLTRTTTFTVKEGGISYRPIPSRRKDLKVNVDFSQRDQDTTDKSEDHRTRTTRIQLWDKVGDLSVWGSYNNIFKEDATSTNYDRMINRMQFGLHGNIRRGMVCARPYLSFEVELDRDRPTEKTDLFQNYTIGSHWDFARVATLDMRYVFSDFEIPTVANADLTRKFAETEFKFRPFSDDLSREFGFLFRMNQTEDSDATADWTDKIFKLTYEETF